MSFSRAVQRLFEQTWKLKPLSVRNTFNGLLWIGGLALYAALSGVIHAVLGRSSLDFAAALLAAPLSARRCTSRTSSAPTPARYGAVFAIISAFFCMMVVMVASAAAGREVHDELDRIRRGEARADDEVRRQWEEVTAEARSRWETLRTQIQERQRRRDRV